MTGFSGKRKFEIKNFQIQTIRSERVQEEYGVK